MPKRRYRLAINAFLCLLIFQAVYPQSLYSKVQEEFEITQEDIMKATPIAPDVTFTPKIEHDVKVMEKRHYNEVNTYDSPKYRIAKLEETLLGRTWSYSSVEDRMGRLRLASQRKMLSGTALPVHLEREGFNAKRIANDSTPVYDDDNNVGIIDGLMKLYAPSAYRAYTDRKKRMYETYVNE